MSSKRKSDVWRCVRCKTEETDMSIKELQVCAVCGIETWCYIDVSSRVTKAAKKMREVAESIVGIDPAVDPPTVAVIEAETVEEPEIVTLESTIPLKIEVVDEDGAVVAEETTTVGKAEETIESLKARLAKLEGK